jgi:hypothetical protein
MRIKTRLKFFVDILLFIAGLISMGTGLVLLFSPSGPGTHAGLGEAASILDFSHRSILRLYHDWSSLIIIALVVFHLALNWRTILCYFKNMFKIARSRSYQNES